MLEKLPFSTILEICVYLDAGSLVALAAANRGMINLANSYKSYWLPTALRSGLNLPLPTKPWASFSPNELGIAMRKYVFYENNLSKENPTLYSRNKIPWPYTGFDKENETSLGSDLSSENPLDVCLNASLHDNGEWLFILSMDFKLRVLHLRTGTLILEESLYHMETNERIHAYPIWFLDSVDNFEAKYFAITPYSPESSKKSAPSPYYTSLKTYTIHLDPESGTASMTSRACIPLAVQPRCFNIAGDYAIIMEDTESEVQQWPGFGSLHAVGLRTGENAVLPPLLDSISLACSPEYFISLGVTPDQGVELQIVKLPKKRKPTNKMDVTTEHSQLLPTEDTSFILTDSIPLVSGLANPMFDASDLNASIHHKYTGKPTGIIRVWIRDSYLRSGYHIFTVLVNFRRPPRECPPQTHESRTKKDSQIIIEHKIVAEQKRTDKAIIPGSCGRRFFWLQEVILSATQKWFIPQERNSSTHAVLFSSDIDSIAPLPSHMGSLEPGSRDTTTETAYPQRLMECLHRFERLYSCIQSPVEMIVINEWGGTVVVGMDSGDIIVLRYGHS